MFAKHRLPTVLASVLLGLLLFAPPNHQTVAQEEDPNPPSSGSVVATAGNPDLAPVLVPGGPGFFSGNGLVFQPYPNGSVPIGFSGRSVYNPDTNWHYYEAQVTLPHGAIITQFSIWAYDNDATYDIWATIAEMGQDDSSVQQLGYVQSSGAVVSRQSLVDTTIVSPDVDLQNYAYWVEVSMPPTAAISLTSFRIDYAFPSYAPVITKP